MPPDPTLTPKDPRVELHVDFIRETDAGYLVSDGDRQVWLPKAHATLSPDRKTVELPEWLALAKGLV